MSSIRPQPGPQTVFAGTDADIAIFGGAAGPGKSWSLVYEPLRWVHVAGFSGIIFRRERPQLVGGGSVWEESEKLYPLRGGRPRRGNALDWTFPSGSTIEFQHMQAEADVLKHKSKQYAFVGLDECTDFTAKQFWQILARCRTTCGVRPYLRGATNPDPDSHIRELIDWWIGPDGFPVLERSGVLRWFLRVDDVLHWANSPDELAAQFDYLPPEDRRPKSLTFIPARLEDNVILTTSDPDYRANLLAMHETDRQRFLGGNWDVRPVSGDFFPRDRARVVDEAPTDLVEVCRGWDKAATKPNADNPTPDWTVGVKVGRARNGLIYVLDVIRLQDDPLEVERSMLNAASRDGRGVKVGLWQDPGQAGKAEVAHFKRLLQGYVVESERAAKSKIAYAKPFSSQWLAGNVVLVRGPWIEPYLRILEGFPPSSSAGKDDDVDASSIAYMKISESLSALAQLEALVGGG